MLELLIVTVIFGTIAFFVYVLGVRGILAYYREMWYRVLNGPKKPVPPRKYNPCVNMQRIAKLELEIYGDVVSSDVKDHLDTCSFPHLVSRKTSELEAEDWVEASESQAEHTHSFTVTEMEQLDGTVMRWCRCGASILLSHEQVRGSE